MLELGKCFVGIHIYDLGMENWGSCTWTSVEQNDVFDS